MNETGNPSSLPMNAMSEIPAPGADAPRIAALLREQGRVSGYKLSDGRILDKEEAVRLAGEGGIRGVGISERNGTSYLKSLPDRDEDNNLGSLPTVKRQDPAGKEERMD